MLPLTVSRTFLSVKQLKVQSTKSTTERREQSQNYLFLRLLDLLEYEHISFQRPSLPPDSSSPLKQATGSSALSIFIYTEGTMARALGSFLNQYILLVRFFDQFVTIKTSCQCPILDHKQLDQQLSNVVWNSTLCTSSSPSSGTTRKAIFLLVIIIKKKETTTQNNT